MDSWRTTYPGIVPEDFLCRLSYRAFERRWSKSLDKGEDLTFVAGPPKVGREGDPDEVVGFASGGPRRSESYPEYAGELYAIYLLQNHRRGGLGGALFEAVVDGLRQRGLYSMLLHVMEENRPARRFYEQRGGELLGRDEFEVKGQKIKELVYGWRAV